MIGLLFSIFIVLTFVIINLILICICNSQELSFSYQIWWPIGRPALAANRSSRSLTPCMEMYHLPSTFNITLHFSRFIQIRYDMYILVQVHIIHNNTLFTFFSAIRASLPSAISRPPIVLYSPCLSSVRRLSHCEHQDFTTHGI